MWRRGESSRRARARIFCIGGAVGVVGIGVAGCGGETMPRAVVTPAVVWNGGPPAGELEADPWVTALREGTVAFAAATNAANYTDEALRATWREDAILRAANLAKRGLDEGSAHVALGPRPFTPVLVEPRDDGRSASVWVCIGPAPMLEEGDPSNPTGVEAMLYGMQLGEDGERRVAGARQPDENHALPGGEQFTDEYCESIDVRQALFDPAPQLELLLALDGDDVIAPPSPSPTFAVEVPK